ncbi:hypothetical protein FB45DRAFT_1001825 [Roridomyces roridus]|uniref:Uncharacterized protein n=1 Tax=Roridomyces roridus TaxID=1738132 RepID=A0AAD7C206_9AGAR|nr:hypothetical protein FB45DRAFT_1001825 [Roridomyces roridus]
MLVQPRCGVDVDGGRRSAGVEVPDGVDDIGRISGIGEACRVKQFQAPASYCRIEHKQRSEGRENTVAAELKRTVRRIQTHAEIDRQGKRGQREDIEGGGPDRVGTRRKHGRRESPREPMTHAASPLPAEGFGRVKITAEVRLAQVPAATGFRQRTRSLLEAVARLSFRVVLALPGWSAMHGRLWRLDAYVSAALTTRLCRSTKALCACQLSRRCARQTTVVFPNNYAFRTSNDLSTAYVHASYFPPNLFDAYLKQEHKGIKDERAQPSDFEYEGHEETTRTTTLTMRKAMPTITSAGAGAGRRSGWGLQMTTCLSMPDSTRVDWSIPGTERVILVGQVRPRSVFVLSASVPTTRVRAHCLLSALWLALWSRALYMELSVVRLLTEPRVLAHSSTPGLGQIDPPTGCATRIYWDGTTAHRPPCLVLIDALEGPESPDCSLFKRFISQSASVYTTISSMIVGAEA